MNRVFRLLILIHWYPFLLVKSSSFFNFDKQLSQLQYHIYENFSIGATFNLPSSYKCSYSQCLTNLKLAVRNSNQLSMNLWCDSPAVFITQKYERINELACVLNEINATIGSYRLSAVVQVHTGGAFAPIFSAIFPNNRSWNQEWMTKTIVVLNSPIDKQQSTKQPTIKRHKRQDVNIDGVNIELTLNQDGSVNNSNADQTQTMFVNDGTNMNQSIQLNTYTGTLDAGHTADVTCDGASSCPDYPKIDDQGRTICCFSLPQVSDGSTALSSIIYQNGAQNSNDFQVNAGSGQSFNAGNDLSVFLDPVTATSQFDVILPPATNQSTSGQFRLTWIYYSNSTDNTSPLSPSTTSLNDGSLPVNVLRVTSSSAFVQQGTQYNEWFVCPPSQTGQVSLLRSIALLSGNNIDYFRCIYVNNQGIPLKDPTNGQLLVFSSSKNSASDNPTITTLPAIHTDCISIQFFPNTGTSIDLNSILLSITIAFQTAPTTDMSSVMPQVSGLQGTSQIEFNITVDILPIDDNNVGNDGQTNGQTRSLAATDNLSNVPLIPSPQTYNQVTNGVGSPPISNIAPIQSVQSPSSVSSGATVSCQEKTSSTYGTYPPDIAALTVPTKKPPKMPKTQPMIGSNMSATPPAPYQSINVQILPDHTCFDQISFSNNQFLYDILISNSDYTNSIDCLSPTSGCSIDFANAKQPKITLLFTTPACISFLRIPSPSNVQQFSYSMYDENGIQVQLAGATDSQGTLLSSSGVNPIVQSNQYSCGYSSVLQLLTTSDNGPPMRVTIDTGGCFRNSSASTTTIPPILPPIAPANVPSSWSQQIPSSVPAPSDMQPVVFAPSPVFVPSPAVPLVPSPPTSPSLPPSAPVVQQSPPFIQPAPSPMMMPLQQPSQPLSVPSPPIVPPVLLYCANNYQLTPLTFGNQCVSRVVTSDPNVVPDYSINPGNQGMNFQTNIPMTITYQFSCIVYIKYICMTGTLTNVNKFSYVVTDVNQHSIGQGIVTRLTPDQCTPRPLPTAELASQVVITIEETTDGQPPRNIVIDMQACFLLSPSPAPSQSPLSPPSAPSQIQYPPAPPSLILLPPPLPSPPAPALVPLPVSPSETMRASPILSPSLPPPPPPPLPSPVVAPPPAPFQTMLFSPILQPLAPAAQPTSPAMFPSTPLPYQIMVASRVLLPPLPSPPAPPPPPLTAPPPPVFQTIVASPILYTPPPQIPPSLALISSPVLQTRPPPPPFQAILSSPIQSSPPIPATSVPLQPPSPPLFQTMLASPVLVSPSAPSPSQTILASPILSPPAPPPFQTILASPILSPPAPPLFQTILASPVLSPSAPPPFQTILASPVLVSPPAPPPLQTILASPILSPPLTPVPMISTSAPFIAVTPPTMSAFSPNPIQPSPQVMAPAPPPFQIQPPIPLQTAPMPVPIQAITPSQQTPSTSPNQNAVTPAPSISNNMCPQVSLASHPGVELIVFNDGTNVTSDLDPDGNGCNLVSIGTTMTVLLRDGMSATFSSIGVSSPNVNQIDVALFDEQSNRPLIQSPQGTTQSPVTLNPSVQNLPVNPAATLAVTFLKTVDGQPPKNVKLLVYACFPTVAETSPTSESISPPTSGTNTLNQQPYYPVDPSIQTYPYNQQYQYSPIGPTDVCIDPVQPAQVTSVGNTSLPANYYSSNQCVCICQSGIVMPPSSGVIQYYPPSRTINKRTIIEKSSEQRRRKRHHILTKSKN